ncbi:MAG: ABC transporter substrate-binding protein [Crocinitomicaceae bacterium]
MSKILQVITIFLILNLLPGCINKSNLVEAESKATDETSAQIKIHYAKGFRAYYFEGGKFVEVLHPKTGEVLDQIVLIGSESAVVPDSLKAIKSVKISLNTIASQSTTHVSFLDRIEVLDKLKAIGFAELVRNENARKLIDSKKMANLSEGQQMNKEILIDLRPELFFMYPFDQQSVEQIKMHVKTMLTTEYLETSPLAKAEWIKFFALFFNREEMANQLFDQIVNNYEKLVVFNKTNRSYFMNLPYNGIWDFPPANSYSVQLMSDAGMNYIFQQVEHDANLAKTTEEVIDQCIDTDFWIIIAQRNVGFGVQDLINENYFYKEFRAVKLGNVVMCNTTVSDYFGDALLEPDKLLSDLTQVIYGTKDSTEYFYRLK